MALMKVCHVVVTAAIVIVSVAVSSFGAPVSKNDVISVTPSPLKSMSSPSTLFQELDLGTDGVEEDNDDPFLTTGDEDVSVHRNAVRNRTRRWPGGIVPYIIDKAYSDAARASILEALAEIEADVVSNGSKCIQFVNRTTEPNYLEISLGVGCHSNIGFTESDTGAVVATLGPGCEKKGVVMHEILHILGFFHEQNRLDRDLYVDINETNIAKARDFDIRNETEIDDLGTPYDFLSIMHYGAYNMAKDKFYPVTTPKPQYATGLRMGQRHSLSQMDVLKIQRLYECTEDTSNVQWNLEKINMLSCDFAFGICDFGTTETTRDENSNNKGWVVKSGPTEDGPQSGFTNGRDPYLYASSGDDPSNTTHISTIVTPMLTAPDEFCITYFLTQAGPSSFISMYVTGPDFPRLQLRHLEGIRVTYWMRDEVVVVLPGKQFQVEINAHIREGSVAIDDFFILRDKCVAVMG